MPQSARPSGLKPRLLHPIPSPRLAELSFERRLVSLIANNLLREQANRLQTWQSHDRPLFEIKAEAQTLGDCDRRADERFRVLDALEAQDAPTKPR